MTNGAEHASCRNPGCTNPVTPSTGSGRPRKYCSTECRTAFHRVRGHRPTPDTSRHDGYVHRILDELLERVEELCDLAHSNRTALTGTDLLHAQSLALLKGAAELGKDLADLDAAIVQQARDRGMKVSEIGRARNISADKASRDWPADSIDRRMQLRDKRPRPNPRLRGRVDYWGVTDDCTFLPGQFLPEPPTGPGLPLYGNDATEGPPLPIPAFSRTHRVRTLRPGPDRRCHRRRTPRKALRRPGFDCTS